MVTRVKKKMKHANIYLLKDVDWNFLVNCKDWQS